MEEMRESTRVASVVTGEGVLKVRDRLILRAYLTRATTGMNLSRAFTPTVREFNATYGTTCKKWADVAVEARRLMAESD